MQLLRLPASKTRDIVILFVLVIAILMFRRFDAFTNPQIWAEDCLIFFKQVEEEGVKSLFIPYSGYLLLMQRLVVLFFHSLSVSYFIIPVLYNITAVIITFLVVYGMYESAVYMKLKHKIAYATWFLFMPVAPDLTMIMGATGWYANLNLLNYIFVGNTFRNNAIYALHTLIILILALTQPFSLFFSPATLLMLIIERKEMTFKKALPYILVLAGGATQFVHIFYIDTGFYRGVPVPPEPNHLLRLFTNNVSQMFFFRSGVFPFAIGTFERIMSAVMLLPIAGVLYLIYKKANARRKYVLLISASVCFMAFIKTYWPNESFVLALENARYYLFPFACIGWLTIIALDDRMNLFYIGAYFIFFWVHRNHMRYSLGDKHWKKQLIEFYDHKRDAIDINPDGWKFVPDRSKMRKTP